MMIDHKIGEERVMRYAGVEYSEERWIDEGELVRCRDCWNMAVATDGSRYCAHWSRRVPLDGFCHLGEREESE